MRAPRSGREFVHEGIDSGRVYVDADTGEALEVTAEILPLAPERSGLPRTPSHLRFCNHCGELVGRDLSECPHCGRRMSTLA